MELSYTVWVIIAGTSLLGVVSGLLGSFAVLRKQSLLGDAIAHATLPGIGIAFILYRAKAPTILLVGAMIAGWLGTVCMNTITETTRLKRDTALGIVLSVFFGLGLVILSRIQKMEAANQSGLNKYLFGNAATLLDSDVKTMAVLGSLVIGITLLCWKEFKIITFDPDYAAVLGFPIKRLDYLMMGLIVVSIVLGLQTVGVVLMSAMLIAPAAAARQWTDRLSVMVILAAVFGLFSGVIGSLISASLTKMPTGPTIVLVISFIVFLSLILAPNRGLFWSWLRHYQNRKKIEEDTLLHNLLLFTESETDPYHQHDLAALSAIGRGTLKSTLTNLQTKGLIQSKDGVKWGFSKKGLQRAHASLKEVDSGA